MFKGIDLEKEKVEVKPGDLFFVWNRAPFSILVAWMVNKARGNKKPITHAEIAAADGKNASAEAIGYVLVNRKNRFRKSKRLVILRYKEMTPKWDSVFSAIIGLLGKRYDFYLYWKRGIALSQAFLPLLLYFAFKVDLKTVAWVSGISLLVYFPIWQWLKMKANATVACAEATVKILQASGILNKEIEAETISPDDLFNMLRDRPDFELVYDSGFVN